MYNEIDLDKIDINSEPPAEEPARQYYFIAKCREIVKRKSEELGRPLYACTVNMGCQMNARDSEKLRESLRASGTWKAKKTRRISSSTIRVQCGRTPIPAYTEGLGS